MKRTWVILPVCALLIVPSVVEAKRTRSIPSTHNTLTSNQQQGPRGCKSVAKDQINVRSGPGLQHAVTFQAPFGYPVQILETRGDWVNFVDWEGSKGWIHKKFICDIRTVVVLKENVNVRAEPDTRHGVVLQVQRGQVYKVAAEKGDWIKIAYYQDDQEIGWIRHDMVFGE